MRRESLAPIAVLLLGPIAVPLLTAGMVQAAIMTDVNQSATFVRMPARNATPGIDGVYYNPAGLTRLSNGWHFSLNNQIVFRDGQAESDYAYLSDAPSSVFPADATTGLFPGFYGAYKIDKWAISAGFYPILGLGSTDYSKGLPAFEMIFSDLVPALQTSYGVTGYSAKTSFEETSSSFGYQLGVSYEINPTLSVFGGGRLVTAKKTYRGGVTDVSINPTIGYDGSYSRADEFASAEAASFASASQSYSGAAAQMQALINAGLGSYTLSQAQNAGYISSSQRAQYESALVNLGFSSAQIAALRITQVHSHYGSASAHYADNAALMTGIQVLTGDRDLEVTQTGTGFAPILGLNLTVGKEWAVGLKYEFETKLELKNDTQEDGFGSFLDGAKVRQDLPAMVSLGVSYTGRSELVISSAVNYYFDRNADYGRVDAVGEAVRNSDIIDANYLEFGAGIEYAVNERVLLSTGYMFGKTGVSEEYQSLAGFSLDSHTLGFGGQYLIRPDLALNVGCSLVRYRGDDREYVYSRIIPAVLPYDSDAEAAPPAKVTDKYSRSDVILAVGVDYSIRE